MKFVAALFVIVGIASSVYVEPDKPPRREGDPIGCNELAAGSYALPDNDGCNQQYVSCIGYGYYVYQDCGHYQYFDEQSGQCRDRHYVYACGGVHIDPIEPEPIPHDDTVDCTGIYGGTKLLPADLKGTCSDIYYECVIGYQYAFRRDCAPGTSFDEKYMDCADHYQVEACTGGTRQPYVPTPEPDEVERVYLDDYECPYPGRFKHPDYDCSPFMVVCDGSYHAELVECPGSPYTFYDAEIEVCGSFYDVPACSGKDRPVPEPQPPAPVFDVNFDCSSVEDGNYAYPPDAECPTAFLTCVQHSVRQLIECPFGTVYHADDKLQGACLEYCGDEPHPEPEPHVYPEPEVYPPYPAPEPNPYPAPEPQPIYPPISYPQPEPVPPRYPSYSIPEPEQLYTR